MKIKVPFQAANLLAMHGYSMATAIAMNGKWACEPWSCKAPVNHVSFLR
jgi:hypothetical protein